MNQKGFAKLWTLVIAIVVIAGFYLLLGTSDSGLKPGRVAIAGELDCLPAKEVSAPCAIGLESDDGKFYSFGGLSESDLEILKDKKGQQVEVSGVLMKGPALAGYEVAGLIEVETVMQGETSVIFPEDPEKAGLAQVPDLPLAASITQAVSVKFLVEHRSALHGKTVLVSGVVVDSLLGEKACPPGIGGCAEPRIFIADTKDASRDTRYDFMILVCEDVTEKDYEVGKRYEVLINVEASKVAVIGRKPVVMP